jgi:hypothetical protein
MFLIPSTYEDPSAIADYVYRGLGCLPPNLNDPTTIASPTFNASQREYTFTGLLANCRYQFWFTSNGGVDETGRTYLPCNAAAVVVIPPDSTITPAKCNGVGAYFDDERKSCMYSISVSVRPPASYIL